MELILDPSPLPKTVGELILDTCPLHKAGHNQAHSYLAKFTQSILNSSNFYFRQIPAEHPTMELILDPSPLPKTVGELILDTCPLHKAGNNQAHSYLAKFTQSILGSSKPEI